MSSLTEVLTLLVLGGWPSHCWPWAPLPRKPHLLTVHVGLSLSLSSSLPPPPPLLPLSPWPRYHYYGIAVKESSQYYDVMYSKKGAAWVSETGKKEVSKQTVAYSPRSKLGTLLPEFPNVKDLNLPASLPEEKVTTSEVSLGVGGFPSSLFHTTHTTSLPLFLCLSAKWWV